MLKSRIESKSGNNKSWKASPELFDGTIRSSGTDDRPSTGLCGSNIYALNGTLSAGRKAASI